MYILKKFNNIKCWNWTASYALYIEDTYRRCFKKGFVFESFWEVIFSKPGINLHILMFASEW